MSNKTMIAIPTLDYIHWRFSECLMKLSKRMTEMGYEHEIRFKGGTLVYLARDELAKEAISEGFNNVLWLDSDMIFEDTLYLGLELNNKDFVTGIYNGRHGKAFPCLFKSLVPPERYEEDPETDLTFEVAGCGFGCALTTTELLNRVLMEYCTCFMPTPQFGEDLAFCSRVANLDIPIYADGSVRCGHIGHGIIGGNGKLTWI